MKHKNIHIEAEIKVIPFGVSGRRMGNDIRIDSYFPTLKFQEKYNYVFLSHSSKEYLKSGEKSVIGLVFKFPSLSIGRFMKGDEFELTEGPKTIIKGRISKIVNPLIDKSKWELFISKSIEVHEKDYWKDKPEYASSLIEKCHNLRKLPLSSLSNDQLRLSLSQDLGIKFTVPLIVTKLLENIFIECDFYPGDLLFALFRKLNSDWGESSILKKDITFFIQTNFAKIKQHDEIPEKYKRELYEMLIQCKE